MHANFVVSSSRKKSRVRSVHCCKIGEECTIFAKHTTKVTEMSAHTVNAHLGGLARSRLQSPVEVSQSTNLINDSEALRTASSANDGARRKFEKPRVVPLSEHYFFSSNATTVIERWENHTIKSANIHRVAHSQQVIKRKKYAGRASGSRRYFIFACLLAFV
jgi:hypothetical protein